MIYFQAALLLNDYYLFVFISAGWMHKKAGYELFNNRLQ